jgi:carbon monoxide dehydrogenase subunit G
MCNCHKGDDFMCSHLHKMEVNAPIHHVWKFVSSIDHWAPLVPGYIDHEILNKRESTWKFKSELGAMKKVIQLNVAIINWEEPNKVTFDLKSMNETLNGNGYFEAIQLTNNKTRMAGYIELSASGAWGKIVNPILKSNIPIMTKELTMTVGQKIEAVERNLY